MELKKRLRHPLFAISAPILLGVAVLLALRYLGGHYNDMPFLYAFF